MIRGAILWHPHQFGELLAEGSSDVADLQSSIIAIFVIAGSDIDGHLAIVESLPETRPVFLRLALHLRFIVPPSSVHNVAGIECKIRPIFLKPIKEPVERILPSRLGIANVPIEDVRNTGESNFFSPTLRRRHKHAAEQKYNHCCEG